MENARIMDALEVGAVGYLLKDAEPEDIIRALGDAAAGGVPLSPKAARALLPSNRPSGNPDSNALSACEREVLSLVAVGLPNKSIARRLTISEKTVKAHLTRVFTVLGVSDRASAALRAQRHGVVRGRTVVLVVIPAVLYPRFLSLPCGASSRAERRSDAGPDQGHDTGIAGRVWFTGAVERAGNTTLVR